MWGFYGDIVFPTPTYHGIMISEVQLVCFRYSLKTGRHSVTLNLLWTTTAFKESVSEYATVWTLQTKPPRPPFNLPAYQELPWLLRSMNALFLLQVGVSPSSFASSVSPTSPCVVNSSGRRSNFEPMRSKMCIRFLKTFDKELNKLRTQTHAQLPRQCAAAATKTVEPTRRVTAWLLPAWREEQRCA